MELKFKAYVIDADYKNRDNDGNPSYVKKVLDVLSIDFEKDEITTPYKVDKTAVHKLSESNLMIFTGGTDKNGTAIYSGHVLKSINGYRYLVEYNVKDAYFKTVNGSFTLSASGWVTSEIMGDVYETPEILKNI